MNFLQASTSEPIQGNYSLPMIGGFAIMQKKENMDGTTAYHFEHIDTSGKTPKQLKKEIHALLYGKMSAFSRLKLRFHRRSLTLQLMAVRLHKTRDWHTWKEKTVLEVLPPMWLAEKHLAVFKARNLPVHLPILLADTEQNLNVDVENCMGQTRLVLLAKKTLGGGAALSTVVYHEEEQSTLQLGALSGSPSHRPEGGEMIAVEQLIYQEVASGNDLTDARHIDDDDIILLNQADVAKMAHVVYGGAR